VIVGNSYLRNECEKTFFAHERECFICANVPNTSSRIEVRTIFFDTNIISDLSYTIYGPCDCQSVNRINSDLFSLFRNFRHPKWGIVVLDDFETLVCEIDVRALVLQYHPESICISAQTSISCTIMRSRNLTRLYCLSIAKIFVVVVLDFFLTKSYLIFRNNNSCRTT
jgi:hypothetical protein